MNQVLHRVMPALRVVAAVLPLVLLAPACSLERPAADEVRPHVVTTVAPIADLVARVVGEHGTVTALVPEGVDSHTFEPRPGDARRLAQADVFIANGLSLEEPSLRLARANLRAAVPLATLGDDVLPRSDWVFDRSFPRAQGKPNPHLWLDVRYAIAYVERIEQVLSEAWPEYAHAYAANAAALTARLEQLDDAIAAAVATVPADSRKLVTYHDSWAYFGPRYGLFVVGALQPADFSEPSAREVRALIEQIRAERVPAVFGSEVFPSDVLDAIAQETNVRYVGELADDDLPGEPGEPEHSYVGMMVRNVRTIVEALGGDASALRALEG